MPDYDDPQVEAQWCAERRASVEAYLQSEGVETGAIGEWPAWHLAPYVSVWAIESRVRPGWVGWWAISGDLPNDYVSADAVKHPREALRAFSARWSDAGRRMAEGDQPEGFMVGPRGEATHLGPLLLTRAALLAHLADDEAVWADFDR